MSSQVLADNPPKPSNSLKLQKVSLQLNWKHQFEFAGFYAAIEKGFYARKGLDVEIKEYENGLNVVDEVLSRRADYGSVNIQVIARRLNGDPITLLGNYFKRLPLVIITQTGISTFKELKGKRLMISNKDLNSPTMRYIFKQEGLIPGKNITIIPHSFSIDEFVDNKVDAMTAFLSNEPYELQNHQKSYEILDFSSVFPVVGEQFLFTREKESFQEKQRDLDFLEASTEGWKYALEHQDEIIDLILSKYSKQKSRAALKFEAERIYALIMPKAFPIGSITPERLHSIASILLETGEVKNLERLNNFLLPQKTSIFSSDELQWLQQHPHITLGVQGNIPPIIFKDYDEKWIGLIPDYIDKISQVLGINISLKIINTLEDIEKNASSKKIDGMAVLHPLKYWKPYFNFSNPIIKTQQYLFIRSDRKHDISNLSNLHGKSVGYLKNIKISKEILQEHPEIKAIAYDNFTQMTNALLSQQVDALTCNITLEHWRKTKSQSAFSITGVIEASTEDVVMAIREDWSPFIPILNKAIASIGESEVNNLIGKWFGKIEIESNKSERMMSSYSLWIIFGTVAGVFLFTLLFFYFVLPRLFSDESLAHYFGSRLFRLSALLSLSIIIALVALIVWSILLEHRKQTVTSIQENLEFALKMTQKQLDFFIKERKNYLMQLGRDPELVNITEALLSLPRDTEILKKSTALQQARVFFNKRKEEFIGHGFFIISPDNISLASQRDDNEGTINFIGIHKPNLIEQAFSGKAVFIPPLRSDVPLNNDSTDIPKTLFFAVPIQNRQGQVIAVLTQRLLPEESLSKITAQLETKTSGETYIIDKEGFLLAGSRFKELLKQLKLLQKNTANLQIKILDPGGNLLEGHVPALSVDKQPFTRMVQQIKELQQKASLSNKPIGYSHIVSNMTAYRDYRGVPVYGIGIWNESLELALIAEIDVAEAMQKHLDLRQKLLLISGITLLLSMGATFLSIILGQRTARTLNKAKHELEYQVAERTERLTSIIDNAADGIIVLNSKGIIEEFSPAAEQIFQYQRSEMLGKSFKQLLHSSFQRKYTSYFFEQEKNANSQNLSLNLEVLGLRKNRTSFPMEFSLTIAKIKEGSFFTAIVRDISDRKEAEQQLINSRNEQELLKKLITLSTENKPLASLLTKALNIILSSSWMSLQNKGAIFLKEKQQATLKMVAQKNLSEAIQNSCQRLAIGHCLCGRAAESKKIVFADCVDDRHEIRFDQMQEHGHYCVPFLYGQELLGVLTVYVDHHHHSMPDEKNLLRAIGNALATVIKQKQIETDIVKARQEADAANKAKSEFLANMSHEIRTPMNAIIGLSHLALNTNLTDKQYDYINKVHHSATALLNLINDILDYSKIEAGQLNIEIIEFQLEDVLSHVAGVIEQAIAKKELEFLLDISQNIPQKLLGDPFRLGQILLNLLNNAIKFTDKGEIVLHINVEEQTPKNIVLRIAVQDTGIGLSAEQINKLFQAFSQADESTTRKYGGTGLGLSICKQLVEMMGGKIWVESEIDIGSTFIFLVRLGMPENTSDDSQYPPLQAFKESRILIVDDNSYARSYFKNLIENLGVKVFSVNSATAAMDELQHGDMAKKPYQLVFMDWKMPDIDGIEAIYKIKTELSLTDEPKILLMTGFVKEELFDKAKQAGAVDVISKSINYSALTNLLFNILGEDTFVLQRKQPQLESVEEKKSIAGTRILIVEDNMINQQVAGELLSNAGVLINFADNGLEAVNMLINTDQEIEIDGILMDIQMPKMDGFEATRRILADERYKNIPIIGLTAHAMPEELNKCLNAGMKTRVSKPIIPKELFAAIKRYITCAETIDITDNKNTVLESSKNILLPQFEGFDIHTALERLGGDKTFYSELVEMFIEEQSTVTSSIRQKITDSNMKEAARIVHTTKGLAGTIGAIVLQEKAESLETGIENNECAEIIERKFNEFENQMNASLACLKQLRNEHKIKD